MKLLVAGAKKFKDVAFEDNKLLFKQLENSQSPETLFITCSDSRIDPNLITQTKPGDLFVLRNAGNIVPNYELKDLASAAVIEYAIQALSIKEIIVCGHSNCGAMKGLHGLDSIGESLPIVKSFLEQNFVNHDCTDLSLNDLIIKNVNIQMGSLLTFPFIKEKVDNNELTIHGWVYSIADGSIIDVSTNKPIN